MKPSKGFTIIELIIVIAIFMFIIGAAISIFISVSQSQKKVLADQQLLNQVSYVEEYMSKALRMAEVDNTGTCLGTAGAIYSLTRYNGTMAQYMGIKFLNQNTNICQEFFIDNTDPSHLILEELKGGDSNASALTPPGLQITSIKFAVNGPGSSCLGENPCIAALNGDNIQPRATMVFIIKDIQGNNKIIQIAVSQRNINYTP